MAQVRNKPSRRYRRQFTMSSALYNRYEQCLRLAEQLKLQIDVTREFELWFSRQLNEVETLLNERQLSLTEVSDGRAHQ